MVQFDTSVVADIAGVEQVKDAAQAAVELIDLWPLDDATQLENDTKYGENLQVRTTQSLARIITGEDVSIADAEFVYEGASEIPGRPQSIVNSLLDANDAYESSVGLIRSADWTQVTRLSEALQAGWTEEQCQGVQRLMQEVLNTLDNESGLEPPADVHVVCRSLSTCIAMTYQISQLVETGSDNGCALLPIILLANECNEQVGIPRFYLSDTQLGDLIRQQKQATVIELGQFVAPLLEAEWKSHRVDVLWDPNAAKKQAREDDERKSREALQAKFAHIPEDTSKPTVEL